MRINIFRLIPFILQVLNVIATIDANYDGVIDGKEKLEAAKKIVLGILQMYPMMKGDPEKIEKTINMLVAILNLWIK